jgi:hypothetical protein
MNVDWRDFSAGDVDEKTKLTEEAHTMLLWKASHELGPFYESAEKNGELRIMPHHRAWLCVVRGQSSAAGRGKTGAHPERVAWWRETSAEIPVIVLSVEGVSQGRETAYVVWPGRGEPEPAPVDKDTAHKRFGWWVRDLRKVAFSQAALKGPHRKGVRIPDELFSFKTLRIPPLDTSGATGRMF